MDRGSIFVSHCLVQCGLAIRQESPGPADHSVNTPVHGHIKCIIEHHSHLLYNSGYYTHHMLSHSESLHFTNECVCVCVCVCVCCTIPGINRNNEYFPKQRNPISLFNRNSLYSVRHELSVQLLDTAQTSPRSRQDELAKPRNLTQ